MRIAGLILTALVALSATDGLLAGEVPTASDPQPLNTDASSDVADDRLPAIATDGFGHWRTVWMEEFGERLKVAQSSDNGLSWSDWTPLFTQDLDKVPDIAADGSGTWVVVWWSGPFTGDQDIYVVSSVNNERPDSFPKESSSCFLW